MQVFTQSLGAVGKSDSFRLDLPKQAVLNITAITGSATLERKRQNGSTWIPVLIGTSAATFSTIGSFIIEDPTGAADYRMSLDSGSALTFNVEY